MADEQSGQLDLPPTLPVRRILVIGSGAIGVAFLPALVSTLVWQYQAQVRVVLTSSATDLVSARSLAAISRHPVSGPGWPAEAAAGPAHVRLAEWAELVLAWPATLSFCARCAYGMTTDLASATLVAADAPVLVAPSLARSVATGATFGRIRTMLTEAGVTVVGPVQGRGVADTAVGPGACVSIAQLLRTAAAAGRGTTGHGASGAGDDAPDTSTIH
ncbi:flavoprotein [Solwaraspora sp. WMMD791]|uniref:flavoprotein n=1 Tax=Solwaraspora sp. WMMD791 TaxID=3016086 RepID=UPI00249A7910|nr:flavoprotein [Solwaraspora sp. WMMD791]WFE28375.1 flavoprotein [Solwaraspora sp. WMMD791]